MTPINTDQKPKRESKICAHLSNLWFKKNKSIMESARGDAKTGQSKMCSLSRMHGLQLSIMLKTPL